ncbi:hypothetical protein K440DRAFT_640065 [Wilcoxina mikolae CBS 423.85]|nr:hypothetical protein K440DRAFT_640065 [Wilcoxina mikolae CBS 423.85]
MASLDISPEIGRSYQKLVSGPAPNKPSPTYAQWAVFSVSAPLQNAFVQSSAKASTLKVHTAGEEFNDGKVQFAFVKVKDPNSGLPKFALICWCGEGVPERVKGYFTGHLNAVTKVLHGYHVQVTARSESDLSPESIIQKVADASGSKYSSSSSSAPPKPTPKPAVATKPVFQPTRVTGGTLPIGSRAPYRRDNNEDADGWGSDAPPVTRSQLEKVASAYKPTKVDINALKAQPSSTTSGFSRAADDGAEVVKGAYQPVGKVDIAALRKGYKEERPAPVKGSYEPVDVGSIRKATPARPEPEPTPAPSIADRTSAFSQSERLTSLPKPKVAKKFGPGAPSFGTKPLTPGGFGASPSVPPPVQIGSISKTGSTKSPAQIWAEKKARERGLSGASDSTPPAASSAATEQQRAYTGASASSQQHEEETASSSAGGVSALRNRFTGAAPMGAPTSPQRTGGDRGFSPVTTGDRAPPAPPVDTSSRPSFGVPMPGLPARSEAEEKEDVPYTSSARNIPTPPPQPRSPTPPTPEIPGSPVRIVMPVARSHDEVLVTKPEEPAAAIPTESLSRVVPREEDLTDAAPVHGAPGGTGLRAIVLYDYTADEENEINLVDGQVVTDIDMVDEDWWRGINAQGQEGLFPSNYVELIQGGAHEQEAARAPSPEPAPAVTAAPVPEPPRSKGHTALAIYDYEATEDNELSFPDGAIIEDVQFPDEDWWQGTYQGQEGLFPANYVELRD